MLEEPEYHSALSKKTTDIQSVYKIQINDNSFAITHDVFDNLPQEYDNVDIFYSEISWQHGIKIFNERSGVERDFYQYMERISQIITHYNKPTIIICGKNALKHLPEPKQIIETKLKLAKNSKALAAVYNFEYTGPYETTDDIIETLADTYNCIGDFCCGYGRSGYIFNKKNKDFVQSDYNPKCIGYIKNYYLKESTPQSHQS
jgi:hypothetical protein